MSAESSGNQLSRPPRPELRPLVSQVWVIEPGGTRQTRTAAREFVLPTGAMHLVFRMSDRPLRVFEDDHDKVGHEVGSALVGGVRSSAYIRDVSSPSSSVGAMLKPGAARILFNLSTHELGGRHTRLDELWGSEADRVHEQLQKTPNLNLRLEMFERMLLRRIPLARSLDPVIAEAVSWLAVGSSVRDVVARSGLSHRHFVAAFRETVGLRPKVYSRLRRFQWALHRLASTSDSPASIAFDGGYSDQPHFNREFREFTGMSPSDFLRRKPRHPNHVRVDP